MDALGRVKEESAGMEEDVSCEEGEYLDVESLFLESLINVFSMPPGRESVFVFFFGSGF